MAIGRHLGVIVAAALLSGCSAFDSVWGTLSGVQPNALSAGRVIAVPTPKTQESPPSVAAAGAAAAPATAPVAVIPPTPPSAVPAPSGGIPAATPQAHGLHAELQRLEDDLARQNAEVLRLRQALAQDSASYYGTVATIHSRLQMGITPGDPEIVAQWNLAQVALDRMSANIARLAVLSGETANDSTLAGEVLDSIKTGRAGNADQHQLPALESEAKGDQALVEKLVDAVADDIARQTSYLDNERMNLVGLLRAIKSGELYAKRPTDGRYAALAAPKPKRGAALSGSSERKPLVVIRFRQANVPYEEALYGAVKSALERRPSASFDLVSVAPLATTPAQVSANSRAAKRHAESVLHSLTGMGVPAERVSLSSTTSANVQAQEVQVYVR